MKKIIIALDVPDFERAAALVKVLSPFVDLFKVGPVLFLQEGLRIVEHIRALGKHVFLDLKFHDIPATVERSVASARDLGVYSVTVHSCGGEDMMRAAVSVPGRPRIWAVTVLTSQAADPGEVVRRAALSRLSGVDGVIASPLEIAVIKDACGADCTVVTPGIRPAKTDDDQKRVATPESAVSAGADFIVIGRPIIEAHDPAAAAALIARSIGE